MTVNEVGALHMSVNPFEDQSPLNAPLRIELCQRIHFQALQAVVSNCHAGSLPDRFSIDSLRNAAAQRGRSICLLSPLDINFIFRGVTNAVYQAIEQLYCTRVKRSITMIWRMLNVMAAEVNMSPVSYEAVWAICQYLAERRAATTAVTIRSSSADWHIVVLSPDIQIQQGAADSTGLIIVYVLDTEVSRILSFRITHQSCVNEDISLAVYDALAFQRRPATDGSAGLVWSLPARIQSELGNSARPL